MAAGEELELTSEERQFLELVYDHFDREVAWLEPSPVKRRLYQRGVKVDIDTLLGRLSPTLIREAELGGTRLRLTLAGLRALYKMREVNDFICFLRAAIDKYASLTPEKTLTAAEIAKRCGADSQRLRKLALLLEAEPFIAHVTRRTQDFEVIEWEVSDEVTRYEKVFTIEAFLAARRLELEKLAKSDIPPAHLLAAEGILFQLSPGAPMGPPLSAETSSRRNESDTADSSPRGLHPLIEQQVRPQFVIGRYDLGVFAALKAVEVRVRKLGKFGNELVGVELMNRAFGPGGPLADASLPRGEQDGVRNLFAGAYGVLRNPAGHRDVNYEDVGEAQDAAYVASLLMHVLDRIQKRLGPRTRRTRRSLPEHPTPAR